MQEQKEQSELEKEVIPAQTSYSYNLSEAEKLIESTEEETEDNTDYSSLSKEDIVAKAEALIHATDVRKANDTLNRLREALEAQETAERPAQIKAWTDAGNDPRDFKPVADQLHIQFGKVQQRFREKREEERRRAEEEKLANLRKKEEVLNKMKALIATEENEQSLKSMRELMREWREIRQVPKEFQDDLYERYRFYVDKFYDNLTIFHELKDLDREKNLEVKIELIKKVEVLREEKNLRKALVTLNKYHEDWKNAGPVRKEISDEIWHRFKAASDVVISDKKAIQEEYDKIKQDNLKLKTLLVEKAEAAIAVFPTKLKDWSVLGKELDALMEEWKKTGPVPKENNQEIWNKFRGVRQSFFEARREFFKDMNASREDNLAKKIALCENAEKLQDGSDFNATSDALNKLQEEWKKVGPVPEKENDMVWKRFRGAFDHFYHRKNAFYENRRVQENTAVHEKEQVISELEKLKEIEDSQEVFKLLKELQQRWAKSGFVSGKAYFNLQKKYQELSDFIFTKFKRNSEEMKESVMREHYEMISGAPDGNFKIQGEERKLRDRISKLRDEVGTIENNKSFFAHSKNAQSILKQFDDNIEKLNVQIEKLEKELKVIRSYKK
ncbi:MAG: DUF349 domain-containing protein [Bacteroidetes bacterium]|nr:DUF349 domain-containing protein [Bacteroidota bacterium]